MVHNKIYKGGVIYNKNSYKSKHLQHINRGHKAYAIRFNVNENIGGHIMRKKSGMIKGSIL